MKRFILLFSLVVTPIFLMAQDVVPVIPDWGAAYEGFFTYMATWVGVAALAMFVGEVIIRIASVVNKFLKKAIIIVLAIGISFIGMAANIGFLAESPWWEAALSGVASGLIASGIWTQNFAFLRSLVEMLISFLKSKEPS